MRVAELAAHEEKTYRFIQTAQQRFLRVKQAVETLLAAADRACEEHEETMAAHTASLLGSATGASTSGGGQASSSLRTIQALLLYCYYIYCTYLYCILYSLLLHIF